MAPGDNQAMTFSNGKAIADHKAKRVLMPQPFMTGILGDLAEGARGVAAHSIDSFGCEVNCLSSIETDQCPRNVGQKRKRIFTYIVYIGPLNQEPD